MKLFARLKHDTRGAMLVLVLAFGAVAMLMIVGGVTSYTIFEHRVSRAGVQEEAALFLAEAGMEYYTWHLQADPADFQDGTGQSGPYEHTMQNKDGAAVGTFTLSITPPSGNAAVVIESIGRPLAEPARERAVRGSFTGSASGGYSILANYPQDITFNTALHGILHSNGGIRFYGTTDSWVQSATSSYIYESQQQNGVWGDTATEAFWTFPVAPFDFASTTVDFDALRSLAQSGGLYFASSDGEGWRLVISASGNGSITAREVANKTCENGMNNWKANDASYWPQNGNFCYDIDEEEDETQYPLPANGIVFVEDDAWIEGTSGSDFTLVAARLSGGGNEASIILPNSLVYAQIGQEGKTGLIAQKDIIVPNDVPANLTIHAAMYAQNGIISRPPYRNNTKTSLTVLGVQIAPYGTDWNYQNGFGNIISGFLVQNLEYDDDLGEYLPPEFPGVTPPATSYRLTQWEEI